MALDLIPARHERDIHAARRLFAIDETLHAQLMTRARPHGDYPVLHKMRDYYADTVFLFGELRPLHAELTRIAGAFTDRTQVRELMRFVEQAIADGDNLYATAD